MKKTVFVIACLILMGFVFSVPGQTVLLEGQVICCAECWAQADRTKIEFGTAEDLLKSQACVAKGDPTLLAVREGNHFTLYQLQQRKYRLPGKNWLPFIGNRVAVTGSVEKRKGEKVILVDRFQIIALSIAEQEASNVVGKKIELNLRDPFGTEQRLSALVGRIVLLNFWATYCIPCRTEMPELAAIQNEYAALGVQVVGASTDDAEDREKVLQFIKETKVNFPIWMGATTADMIRFGLGAALPGTVVIGRDGKLAQVISGVVNHTALKKQIELMLAAAEKAAAKERKQQPVIAMDRTGQVSSVPS